MDGIDAILQAEKEAERIRRDARVEADALLGSAEGYRQRTLDAARLEGEEEKQRLFTDVVDRIKVDQGVLPDRAHSKKCSQSVLF